MSFLRSILVSSPLIVLSTVVLGTLSILASLVDKSGRTQHRLARLWGKILLAVSFIRVRAEGLEKLDPSGTYVFVANHGSLMDIPALLKTLRYEFRFFAKKGLYKIPFLGTHLRRAGHLPVDLERAGVVKEHDGRSAYHRGEADFGAAVSGGRSVSRRRARASTRKARRILPSRQECRLSDCDRGNAAAVADGVAHIKSGRVTVRVGEPISTANLKIGDRVELTQRLAVEIAGMLGDPIPAAQAAPR